MFDSPSFKAMAKTLELDCISILKEVRKHITQKRLVPMVEH